MKKCSFLVYSHNFSLGINLSRYILLAKPLEKIVLTLICVSWITVWTFLLTLIQPLEECIDPNLGREYLLCEYNRDEESYRSPWSNEYYPPLEGGYFPSDDLRKLEIGANELLDAYRSS